MLIVIFSSEYKDFIKGDYSRREAGRACWKEMEVKIQKLFNKIIPEVFQDEKTITFSKDLLIEENITIQVCCSFIYRNIVKHHIILNQLFLFIRATAVQKRGRGEPRCS